MSINAPSRIHYNVHNTGKEDLLFQIDSHNFRLYNPENDPRPIYKNEKKGASISDDENDDEVIDEASSKEEFAYESDLRDYLAKNMHIIESGIKLFKDGDINGIEYPVGNRRIDIIVAIDKNNNYVVIELKVSRGYDRVIGQLLRYMGWIEKNQAEKDQQVRGVIIPKEDIVNL